MIKRITLVVLLAALGVISTVSFAEAAIVAGSIRPRVLLHDGEVVVGVRSPAGEGAESGFTFEFTNNLADISIMPSAQFKSPIYEVAIPVWIPLALAVLWLVIGHRRAGRKANWQCQKCGYDMRHGGKPGKGLRRCPECGASRPTAS